MPAKSNLSVLRKVSNSDVIEDPFPHIVVSGAVDDQLYRQLERSFPSAEIRQNGRTLATNGSYGYSARDVLDNQRIDPLWRSWFGYHVSAPFFAEVVELFGPSILKAHPDIERRFDRRLGELRTSVRFAEPMADAALDAQLIYHSAAQVPSRIIGPHLDREVALYAGLMYFRIEGDDSTGGDLELYRFKGLKRGFRPPSRGVPEHLVDLVATIPYQANTLVLFPHSIDAVHAVSIRSPSRHPRLHVNLIAEFAEPIYRIADYCVMEEAAQG
jgi:hypothetical protein